MNITFVLLGIHLIFCLLLSLLRLMGILKCDPILIAICYFVPVFGFGILLVKGISDRHKDRQETELEVERPTADEEKKTVSPDTVDDGEVVPLSEALVVNDKETRRELMMDILYNVNKNIMIDEDDNRGNVVPLEEALVVNDTATRRALIIDVLYSDPGEYVTQLNDAKANGDTEVVHYAATALTEIQKGFDLQFQEIAERKKESPDDESLDDMYLSVLEHYIDSGLIEGDTLRRQLVIFSGLLEKKLKRKDVRGKWTLINKKADADLRLRDAGALDEDIEYMKKNWPDRDGIYLFRLQSAILKKDTATIHGIIREIREKEIYLSSGLRNLIGFWENTATEG